MPMCIWIFSIADVYTNWWINHSQKEGKEGEDPNSAEEDDETGEIEPLASVPR